MFSAYGFPALVERNSIGGYIITFRDIPEAMTEVDKEEDIELYATDALVTALEFYFEDQREVPAPSDANAGEIVVKLPASVVCKVLLLNCMVRSKMCQADVARKIGVTRQEMSRIVNLRHTTKIDTIQKAIEATGRTISFSIQ